MAKDITKSHKKKPKPKKRAGHGKAAKKAAAGPGASSQEEENKNAPHTFVFQRGKVGKNVTELMRDMRRVLEPYTASKLKVRKKNVLKDFVSIAGALHVSHFLIFTKTEFEIHLRVCRIPRGPTLTFSVDSYSLSRDVVSSIKRPSMDAKQFQHAPLLVMNGLTGEGRHLQLLASMFQNMLPSINVQKVKLGEIRRCVLINYDQESKNLELRHYNIKAVPVGMSRGVKKVVKGKIPNLSKLEDVSDLLYKGGDLSESEAELDGPHNEVVLPQDMSSRGNIKSAKSAIRLTEIGPRVRLRLIKIEEGVCEGAILHHELIQKTPAEVALLEEMRAQKRKIKEKRKKQQEANIKKKSDIKDEHRQKTLAGMKKKEEESKVSADGAADDADVEEEEDDAAYYKEEVGEAPEPELFPKKTFKRKRPDKSHTPFKKKKVDSSDFKDGKVDSFHKKHQDNKMKHKFGDFKGNKKNQKDGNFKGNKMKHKNFKGSTGSFTGKMGRSKGNKGTFASKKSNSGKKCTGKGKKGKKR